MTVIDHDPLESVAREIAEIARRKIAQAQRLERARMARLRDRTDQRVFTDYAVRQLQRSGEHLAILCVGVLAGVWIVASVAELKLMGGW